MIDPHRLPTGFHSFRRTLAMSLNSQRWPADAASDARLLSEYGSKRHLYEDFAVAVYKLVDLLLEQSGDRYQIAYRTKTVEGLREKLARKAAQGVWYLRLDDLDDLAGLRVIFFSERSKRRVLTAIADEISGAMQYEERKIRSGYDATHVVLSFGPRRLSLSEYKRFEGLKCEIQVTTVLRHAWSEIEHDLVYKDINGLRRKDPQKFAAMQNRLGEIMERYIKPASAELEDILTDFDD